MNKKKILVVGGVHGDEVTGVEVVRSLRRKSIPGVIGIVAHPEAVKQNKRFLETDMNRSFTEGIKISIEERLAARMRHKIRDFDLIIDLHNTKACGTTCAITVSEPNNLQIIVVKHFGLDKIVVMPSSGSLIACRPENGVALEIAQNDTQRLNTKYFLKKIYQLDFMKNNRNRIIKIYKYAGKVMRKTLLSRKVNLRNLKNFGYLDKDTKRKLRLAKNIKYLPIFFKRNRKEKTAFTLIYETGQLK